MTKAHITQDGSDVTVTREDPMSGEMKTTTYFVAGGYVRIRDISRSHPQVCKGLYRLGATLTATPETLRSVIGREVRRAQATERAERLRY